MRKVRKGLLVALSGLIGDDPRRRRRAGPRARARTVRAAAASGAVGRDVHRGHDQRHAAR